MKSVNIPQNKVRAILLWTAACISFYLLTNNAISSEPPREVARHIVEISGFEFVPKNLNLSEGDIVVWINKDIVPHNITISGSQKLISPELASGEQFTFTVQSSMRYECGFHPSMKGQIIISYLK
jgi:plastocyanin